MLAKLGGSDGQNLDWMARVRALAHVRVTLSELLKRILCTCMYVCMYAYMYMYMYMYVWYMYACMYVRR